MRLIKTPKGTQTIFTSVVSASTISRDQRRDRAAVAASDRTRSNIVETWPTGEVNAACRKMVGVAAKHRLQRRRPRPTGTNM